MKVHFTKESLIFTGEDTPMSHLLLSVMGAFSEFERALIKERQREGIALAKKRGVYKGRVKKISDDQAAYIQEQIVNKIPKSHIALALGISRQTLYVHLRVLVLK